jgi:hypothetical protein
MSAAVMTKCCRGFGIEVAKVEILKPHRYLLATSVPLSREQKGKIVALFGGWIKRDDDIFGQEDLNDILAKNPAIERRFYSLWMTSPVVLERIFNSGIYGRSQFQEQAGQLHYSPVYRENMEAVNLPGLV